VAARRFFLGGKRSWSALANSKSQYSWGATPQTPTFRSLTVICGRVLAMSHPDMSETPVCSARGCRLPAVWALRWNNPRIHDPERRKTWLACAEHRDTLREFLSVRGFLRAIEPLAPGGPAGTR
jgi:hypothetical protein